MRSITTLEQYRAVLNEIDTINTDLEKLNEKITKNIGQRYKILNSIKHLDRGRIRIAASMHNKYSYLTDKI